jgi:hypothetical protein
LSDTRLTTSIVAAAVTATLTGIAAALAGSGALVWDMPDSLELLLIGATVGLALWAARAARSRRDAMVWHNDLRLVADKLERIATEQHVQTVQVQRALACLGEVVEQNATQLTVSRAEVNAQADQLLAATRSVTDNLLDLRNSIDRYGQAQWASGYDSGSEDRPIGAPSVPTICQPRVGTE